MVLGLGKPKKEKIKFRAFFGGTPSEKRKFDIESQRDAIKLMKKDLRNPLIRFNPKARREGISELRKEEMTLRKLIGRKKPKRPRMKKVSFKSKGKKVSFLKRR